MKGLQNLRDQSRLLRRWAVPSLAAVWLSIAAAAVAADVENEHLLEPFWNSTTVYGESVLFVQEKEDAPADGRLLFAPEKVLRVRSARGDVVFEAGRDYTVDRSGRRLVRTAESRIPMLKAADFYKKKDEKQAIRHKAGNPDTWLLYREHGFHDKHVEVDYVRSEPWTGYRPALAGAVLPRVIGKLQQKQDVTIALTGDSISAGANASSRALPPHMPAYPTLLAQQLERVYGGKVTMVNVSVGGATTEGGLKSIDKVIAARPDLVLIAYGMNDVAAKNAQRYAKNVEQMMAAVRAAVPDAEFVLVASSRANPEWNWTPADQFPKYRDALAGLCGKGVALADMTALWTQILERKRYHDLTGNGVNHPNDFGHRLYAEVLLGLLVDSAARG